jgi:hypothetical protein
LATGKILKAFFFMGKLFIIAQSADEKLPQVAKKLLDFVS